MEGIDSGSGCVDPGIGFAHRVAEAPYRRRRPSRRATIRRRRRRQRPRAAAAECRQRRFRHATHQTKRAEAERRRERETNRRPFHRRRSLPTWASRRSARACSKRRAKSSKSSPGAMRAAFMKGRPNERALGRRSRRRGTAAASRGSRRSRPPPRRALGIDEQADRRHERRQVARQRRGRFERHVPRARSGGRRGRSHRRRRRRRQSRRLGTRQAADLDPGPNAHRRITATARKRSGQPVHRRRVLGNRMGGIVVRAQEVEAVRGEGRRRRRAVARAPARRRSSAGDLVPLPTATRLPMRFLIMWCRNASASKSKRQ